MRWQGRSKRKYTGGRYHHQQKKKKSEAGGPFARTSIGKTRNKIIKTRGGDKKVKLLRDTLANVADPRREIVTKAEIIAVKSNSANSFFVRRNIITKGAVIETDIGDAVVTSRPGQDGVINAKLIKG